MLVSLPDDLSMNKVCPGILGKKREALIELPSFFVIKFILQN